MSTDTTLSKPLLWGKHCRGVGCDDYNEQRPGCSCQCAACRRQPDNESDGHLVVLQTAIEKHLAPLVRPADDELLTYADVIKLAADRLHATETANERAEARLTALKTATLDDAASITTLRTERDEARETLEQAEAWLARLDRHADRLRAQIFMSRVLIALLVVALLGLAVVDRL